ncbi:S8 family peptidase [Bacillus sp. FJAT-44742]|uniref:S8 family peptidase n=1 Tax=Bacillus sp. FJAT-44742 TaxID=2014005 RepID=UPI000C245B97|nr:S8 family peptidase [Bacillus sp. FJAT-44742]
MRRHYISGLLILLLFTGCQNIEGTGYSPGPEDNDIQAQMDSLLAEDLSFTTSMFINKMALQLERWTDVEEGTEMEKLFLEELEGEENKYFHSFAFIKDGDLRYKAGNFPAEKLRDIYAPTGNEVLARNIDRHLFYSNPYSRDGSPYMLMAYERESDEWIAGEIDLGFVQSYVGEVAEVADGEGNLFISSGNGDEKPEVRWEEGEVPDDISEEVIPEVGWKISVHSKETQEVEREYKEGEVMVKFTNEETGQQWLENNTQFKEEKHCNQYYLLKHKDMSTTDMMEELKKEPEIKEVEPNYVFGQQINSALPNDEFFGPYQWNLEMIQALEGWEISEGSENVTIAVLDTGVDPDHIDLAEKLVDGFNAFTGNNDYEDHNGHGTHVAGIASAITNNVSGIAGVSWDNLIMPVKVLDDEGEGTLYELVEGITWATDQGADVMNLSLGDAHPSSMLHEAVRYAYDNDVMLIAASGNDNTNVPMYPAAFEEVLAVSAVNERGEKAIFSNYGDYMDVTAPGEHIPSTFLQDEYVFMSGTSMSCPHVAGLAGLVRSISPELTNEEVMELLRNTTEDIGPAGYDEYYGFGLINIERTLEQLIDGEAEFQPEEGQREADTERRMEEANNQRSRTWLEYIFGF